MPLWHHYWISVIPVNRSWWLSHCSAVESCPCAQRSHRFLLGSRLQWNIHQLWTYWQPKCQKRPEPVDYIVLFLCTAVEVNTKCCQALLVAVLTWGCVPALQGAYVFRNLGLEIPPATPLQASSLRKLIPCCNAHNNNKIWISDRWILSYLAYGVLWACSHDIEADQSFRWIHWALDQPLEKMSVILKTAWN